MNSPRAPDDAMAEGAAANVRPPATSPSLSSSTVESAFARVVGRAPSVVERERLYRLRDALGLRDNDAFWSIVMALEYYDRLFRVYPERLAEVTDRVVEGAREACAAAAAREVASVQRALAQSVAETSARLARGVAERPLAVHWVTTALAAVVAFGAMCVHAGYELALRGQPFWIVDRQHGSGVRMALASILAAPAGWMVLALLLPAAVHGVRFGSRLAGDPDASTSERVLGWCIVVCCLGAGGASVLALARLV